MKVLALFFLSVFFAIIFSCNSVLGDSTGNSSGQQSTDSMFFEKFQKGVFPSANYTDTIDTTILTTSPNSNLGASTVGAFGTISTGDKLRYLIRFNIKGYIPKTAVVKNAYLLLYVSSSPSSETGSNKGAYTLTRNFVEGTSNTDIIDGATWNTYDGTNSWTTPGGDFNAALSSNPVDITGLVATDYYTFQLDTSLVQNWVEDVTLNSGILIKNITEISSPQASIVAANETTTLVERPMLIVYYDLP